MNSDDLSPLPFSLLLTGSYVVVKGESRSVLPPKIRYLCKLTEEGDMSKPHAHHYVVEAPEDAMERWEKLHYKLGTPAREYRKLRAACKKCGEVRHYLFDGGIKPITAKRRKKGDGVGATWR